MYQIIIIAVFGLLLVVWLSGKIDVNTVSKSMWGLAIIVVCLTAVWLRGTVVAPQNKIGYAIKHIIGVERQDGNYYDFTDPNWEPISKSLYLIYFPISRWCYWYDFHSENHIEAKRKLTFHEYKSELEASKLALKLVETGNLTKEKLDWLEKKGISVPKADVPMGDE